MIRFLLFVVLAACLVSVSDSAQSQRLLSGRNPVPTAEAVFLKPSGGGANSDHATIQAALDASATHPVFLMGGTFDSCNKLLIPQSGSLNGVASSPVEDWGFNGNSPSVKIQCGSGAMQGGATAHVAFNGHYGSIYGINIQGNQNDGAGVACFEILNNASFTITQNVWYNGCQGPGLRILGDGTVPGPQGGQFQIVRTHIINAAIENNLGPGIYCDSLNGGNVADTVIEFADLGANQKGIVFGEHCGGQPIWHNVKIDFNALDCGELHDALMVMSNIFCDHNGGPFHYYGSHSTPWGGSALTATNWLFNGEATVLEPNRLVIHGNRALINLVNSHQHGNHALLEMVAGSGLDPASQFAIGKPAYLDTATAQKIEPYLISVDRGFAALTQTAAAYTPDPGAGQRDFQVDLNANCPCVLNNPVFVFPGMKGTFTFNQDIVGGRSLTFGSSYQFQTVPTISSGGGASTVVPYVVGADNIIVFQPAVSLPVPGPRYVKANPTVLADNITSGNATIASVGAGNMLLVRTIWCDGGACNGAAANITGITGSGGTCSAVSGTSSPGGIWIRAALWACPNVTAGSKTLTITFANPAYYGEVMVSEWSNANVAPVDGTTGNNYRQPTNPVVSLSTASPAAAGDTIYAYAVNQGGSFLGSPAHPPWQYLTGFSGAMDDTGKCWTTTQCDVYLTRAQGTVTADFYNLFSGSSSWVGLIVGLKGP